MKSLVIKIISLMFVVYLATSCTPLKDIVYVQGVDYMDRNPQKIKDNYSLKIQPDDEIAISVATKDKELLNVFNNNVLIGGGESAGMNSQVMNLTYFKVDTAGYIKFPRMGEIYVEGKTTKDVESYFEKRLIDEQYLKDPTVKISIMNFKISVLGDVNNPGVFEIPSERVSILEAISKAGDLLPTGNRKVYIIREENGVRKSHILDLTSSHDVFNSQYYYLKQNDIVYVKPNATSSINGSSTLKLVSSIGGILGIIGTLMSVIALTK